MSRPRVIVIAAVAVVALAADAGADLRPVAAPGSTLAVQSPLAPNPEGWPAGQGASPWHSMPGPTNVDLYWPAAEPGSPLAPALGAAPAGEVRELPPLPGSARMFLSAMLSLGAFHAFRSARHWHWAALPDWYHTGGPLQIGHTVAFDLDFHSLPPCLFEPLDTAGDGDKPPSFWRTHREQRPPCAAQTAVLTLTGPRAPPAVSA